MEKTAGSLFRLRQLEHDPPGQDALCAYRPSRVRYATAAILLQVLRHNVHSPT